MPVYSVSQGHELSCDVSHRSLLPYSAAGLLESARMALDDPIPRPILVGSKVCCSVMKATKNEGLLGAMLF